MNTPTSIVIPSSAEDRRKIKNAMLEISQSMTRIEAERTLIAEALKDVCTKYNLPRRTFRKLVMSYHKQNFQDEVDSFSELEALWETFAK